MEGQSQKKEIVGEKDRRLEEGWEGQRLAVED